MTPFEKFCSELKRANMDDLRHVRDELEKRGIAGYNRQGAVEAELATKYIAAVDAEIQARRSGNKYEAMYREGVSANDIAREQGIDAFLEGKRESDNPYVEPERRGFWLEGYESARDNPDHAQCAHERGECHWRDCE